jgi:pimeloyl-ACP methyl ester carboxylesterase
MSCGTRLGAQYAALFPDNIRTLALDGVVQHAQAKASNYLIKATSYVLVLWHFVDWVSTNESSVPKGQNIETL